MANLSSKTGFTPTQTRVSLINNGNTTVQNFAAYDAQLLTGFVYVDATTDKRASVDVWIVKNGAGTYEVASADIAGDDIGGSPIVTFSMSGSNLVATLPDHTGFSSAYIQYILNAPTTNTAISGTSATSGSGELTAISNGSFVSDTTGWTGVTRVTSGSPLDPIVTTAGSIANAATAETSTSGGYATIANLSSALRSTKLKVEFYFTTPATDVYRVSVYKGATRLPLSTDTGGTTTLPAGVTGGKYIGYVDTDTAAAYSVNITRTSGSTGPCIITNVIFGPGQVAQGAAVNYIGRDTTLTTGGFGTNSSVSVDYWRVSNILKAKGKFTAGTVQAATATITLRDSLTTDVGVTKIVGRWWRDNASATTRKTGTLYCTDGSTTVLFASDDYTTASGPVAALNGDTVTSNSNVTYFEYEVPVAAWAGTVNLGQGAQVEYAYNSSTSTTADSASFAYGPGGALIQNFAPGTTNSIAKRVRFQYPIQTDDVLTLEVKDGSGIWQPMPQRISTFHTNDAASAYFGTQITGVNSTDVDVNFFSAPYQGISWATINSFYWRVRKAKASAPVGFGMAGTDGSAGLYKAGQAPGITTSATVGTGYIGETQQGQQLSSTSLFGNGTFGDMANISLTAGKWSISIVGTFILNTGTGMTAVAAGISTTSGNSASGLVEGDNYANGLPPTSNTNNSVFISNYIVQPTSTTTYYLKGVGYYSGGTPQYRGRITAVRIA